MAMPLFSSFFFDTGNITHALAPAGNYNVTGASIFVTLMIATAPNPSTIVFLSSNLTSYWEAQIFFSGGAAGTTITFDLLIPVIFGSEPLVLPRGQSLNAGLTNSSSLSNFNWSLSLYGTVLP